MDTSINRRTFVAGATLGAATLAALSAVRAERALADEAVDYAGSVAETVECDIVVCGSGPSGLSAALEAGERGARVVLLESQPNLGGNGNILSGLMGVNSKLAEEQGIHVDAAEVVNREVSTFSYRVDGLRWRDLCNDSGANVDWLVEHGVEFMPVSDGDMFEAPLTYHGLLAGENEADNGIATPLLNALPNLDVTTYTSTPAKEIIMEDGKAAGVYAEREDGSILEVRAGAVILATGGYGSDIERLESLLGTEDVYYAGFPGHNGDGIDMAARAGARNMTIGDPTIMVNLGVPGTPSPWVLSEMQLDGKCIWVNENAERFVDESCAILVKQYPVNAALTQRACYGFCDDKMPNDETNMAYITAAGPMKGFFQMPKDNLDAVANTDEAKIWRADTIEEVAELCGLGDALVETVKNYNELCAAGHDSEFLKDPQYLVPFDTPPYYVWKNGLACTTTLGGVHTDRKTRALTENNEVIPNLYAVGVDGCELFRSFYTLSTPSACNANNINTGRTAAREACESLGIGA